MRGLSNQPLHVLHRVLLQNSKRSLRWPLPAVWHVGGKRVGTTAAVLLLPPGTPTPLPPPRFDSATSPWTRASRKARSASLPARSSTLALCPRNGLAVRPRCCCVFLVRRPQPLSCLSLSRALYPTTSMRSPNLVLCSFSRASTASSRFLYSIKAKLRLISTRTVSPKDRKCSRFGVAKRLMQFRDLAWQRDSCNALCIVLKEIQHKTRRGLV